MGDGTEQNINKTSKKRYKPKYKTKYKTKIKTKTGRYYNRTAKKYEPLYKDKIIRTKGKKKYEVKLRIKDNGDARDIKSKNRIQNISKKDKRSGVKLKWKLKDGGTKKRFKNLDIYESKIIYHDKKEFQWQVCGTIFYLDGREEKHKHVFGKIHLRNDRIDYKKVKKDTIELLSYIEAFYEPTGSKFYIKYYDYEGGINNLGRKKYTITKKTRMAKTTNDNKGFTILNLIKKFLADETG